MGAADYGLPVEPHGETPCETPQEEYVKSDVFTSIA